MLSRINGLADRVLARVVPNTEAAAACTPETYYQYQCVEHLKYRRECSRNYMCDVTCGSWISYTHC